jgi:hypothetical protein
MGIGRSVVKIGLAVALVVIGGSACAQAPPIRIQPSDLQPTVQVVADGLLSPLGLALLPDGTLLVAEAGTGEGDYSAGVSLITPTGEVGRFVSGLYSTRDGGDLGGVALVGVSPSGDRIYFGNFGQGHLWTLSLGAGQQTSLKIPAVPLTSDQLVPFILPKYTASLGNPFDMAYDTGGQPVVTDASTNSLVREGEDGHLDVFLRFDPLPNPDPSQYWPDMQAVPTGIARVGDEFFVTLTGGCPFPDGGGRLVAVQGDRQRVVATDLTMPIDVAVGEDGTIWVLEFARFAPEAVCFTGDGYEPETGRLSRLRPDNSLEPVLSGLDYPGAVLPAPDGSLYISEVFAGRVVRVTLN